MSRIPTFVHSLEQATTDYQTPKFEIGDSWHLQVWLNLQERLQFTRKVFEIVAISSRRTPTYTMNDEQDEIFRGKFHHKELIEVFQPRNRLQDGWFLMHLLNYFETIHSALLQTFYRSNWISKVNDRLHFGKYLTHQCTKMAQKEISCFSWQSFQICLNFTIWNPVFIHLLRTHLKPWTISFKTKTQP